MSTVTQGPLSIGGTGVVLSLPAGTWLWSDWGELTAAMPTAGAIAGIHIGGTVQIDIEFEIGVGPEGAEVSVGHFRIASTSNTGGGLYEIMLPVPLNVLPAGARVAVRARNPTGSYDPEVTLSYYPEPAFANMTTARLNSAPAGADSITNTLTGVAWEWSDWAELTAGEPDQIAIYGLAAFTPILDTTVWEVQLGTGGEGAESIIGTYRFAAPSYWGHILLPVVHLLAASTRVAFRVRANNTATDDMDAALLFYGDLEASALGGVIGPLAFVHWPRRIPSSPAETVTDTFSDLDMQCPADWENGFKEGLVTRWGDAERPSSHLFTGEWQGSTFSFQIADKQGRFRAQQASLTNRYWNDALTVRMTTRATRALLGRAFTVFSGPIVEAQPTAPLLFDVTLGDVVSQGLLSDRSQLPWRVARDGFLHLLDAISDSLDRDQPEPILYGEHTRAPDVESSPETAEGFRVKPIYLGIETLPIAGACHVWLVCGHAVQDIEIYVDGVHKQELPVFNHWLIPHQDEFQDEFGAPYVDKESNTYPGVFRRYTLIYGQVGTSDPDDCATGDRELTAAVWGIEDAGDGSGALITDRFDQYQHFLVNYVANQGQQSYQSGAWLDNPTWDIFDGPVTKVNEASFAAAKAIGESRLTGGYLGAAAIGIGPGDRASAKKWIADWNRSCACRFGINHDGQMHIFLLQPTAAIKAAAPLYTDAYEMLDGSFTTEVKWDEHATSIPFVADFHQASGEWKTSGVVSDADAIENYGRDIPSETREYPFAPGLEQATHLATLESRIRRHRPRYIRLDATIGPDPVTADSLGYRDQGSHIRYVSFDAVQETREERLAQVITPIVRVEGRRAAVVAMDVEDLIDYDLNSSPSI